MNKATLRVTKEELKEVVKKWINYVKDPNTKICKTELKNSDCEYCVMGNFARAIGLSFDYDSIRKQYYETECKQTNCLLSSVTQAYGMTDKSAANFMSLNDRLVRYHLYRGQDYIKSVLVKRIQNWARYTLRQMD